MTAKAPQGSVFAYSSFVGSLRGFQVLRKLRIDHQLSSTGHLSRIEKYTRPRIHSGWMCLVSQSKRQGTENIKLSMGDGLTHNSELVRDCRLDTQSSPWSLQPSKRAENCDQVHPWPIRHQVLLRSSGFVGEYQGNAFM